MRLLTRGRLAAGAAAPWLMALALAATPLYDCPPAGPASPFRFCFRAQVGPIPTTLLEVLLLLALAAGLAAAVERLPWRSRYTWPMLVVLAGASLGVAAAPDHRAALGLWRAYFVEPMLAFVVIAWLASSRRNATLLLLALGAGAALVAVLNLAAFGIALSEHADVIHQPPVVLYRTPNDIPLFLVPIQAFALAVALYGDSRRLTWAAVPFLAVTLLADVTSLSRGGWMAAVVTAVVVGAFSARRLWVLAGVAVAAVAAAAIPGLRHRVLVEFDPSSPDNSVQLRWALWRSAFNMLRHHPVFGSGLSGFQAAVRPYADPAYHEQLIDPHNTVLNWWSETGLVGLAGVAWLLVQVVRVGIAGLRSDPWPRALSIGLLGLVAAFLTHGLVDVPYFKNDLSLEFWALLALQVGALGGALSHASRPPAAEAPPGLPGRAL